MGDPIACDFGWGLTEIRRKMCHVVERQKKARVWTDFVSI